MRNVDQERAQYAWVCVQNINKDYVNLAKGAPALIMTSGLMQTLAFYAGKEEVHHRTLLGHLCTRLANRFPKQIASGDFKTVMTALCASDTPRFYQLATEETMELLRWLRQFAPAVKGEA